MDKVNALPNTSTPTLSLVRTIRTTPFTGTTLSVKDGEGSAFVPNDPGHPNIGGTDSLWLIEDDGRSAWEVDPYTGILKSRIADLDWQATGQYDPVSDTGSGPPAGPNRDPDLESAAYDRVNDTLYVFSGNCCVTGMLPTVYRLMRGVEHTFHPESWVGLPSGSDFTASAWNPVDHKLYVGVDSDLRTYDYRTNTPGPIFRVPNLTGIFGMSFSDDGADLFVARQGVLLSRVDWATKTLKTGWTFDLTPFGMMDSRAVELIQDQFYVFDGYDFRPSGDPLRHAVFVFDVCCNPPSPPTADFTWTQVASPTLTIQFTDASTGIPTGWLWDFGDSSTSTSQNPTHTYAAAGDYPVTLTASNSNGSSSPLIRTVTVTAAPAPPVASFTWAQAASPPLTIQFTDTSTGSPTGWLWDFGDSSTSTNQNPSHTYAAAGDYPVTLTASNSNGSSSPLIRTVTVTPPGPPVASFTWAQAASPPLTIQFTDTSTGGPTGWLWDFGDSSTSTSQNSSHTYAAAGSYVVTLTASNAGGASSSATQTVTVVLAPFLPKADSFVQQDKPDKNFGTAAELRGKLGTGKEQRSYITFVVNGLSGKTVASAKLRLHVRDASPSGGAWYTVSPSWIEKGIGSITWRNAPPVTGRPFSIAGPAVLGAWLEIDATSVVTGEGTYSFAMLSQSTNNVIFDSRETANPPQLVLTVQ